MRSLAIVVFFYDAFVTFDREVSCVWTAKWTGGSYLFIANKWISMLYYVVAMTTDIRSCSSFVIAQEAIQILQFFPGAIFSALRAFVLSKSKLVGILVLALSLAPVGANMVDYGYQLSGENLPLIGCVETNNETEPNRAVILISRVPLVVADTLLIYITWAKLGSRAALTDIRHSKKLSLSEMLFRDGTIYFVVLFVLNVLHLVLSATGVMLMACLAPPNYKLMLCLLITAILISRFLLDLQEANQTVVRLDCDDPLSSSRSPYDVPSFVSSLGAFINPDLLTSSDDELEWDVPSSPDEEKERYTKAESQGVEWSSSSA
ncbi:hypothetical protein K466DRAFT_541688 [Polyporus arcularius HHB13444]|uniref:DUF6533 domain-containing protein n=1 Tax=Polyporus arcularius HHB13444 TaxID=1314778 RepID=A0A5C3PPY2_9APHY|nr:hypothetical protein K466DRAFT_541688 [Polyporus arcularius HHB13444]